MPSITISGTDLQANYLAVAYHNLGGVTVTITADGTPIASYTPEDGKPFIVPFTDTGEDPITADEWVIDFDTFEDVQIAVLKIGVLLETQRPCKYVGHEPINLARTAEILPAKSMKGQFLGGRVIKTGSRNQLEIENLKPDWVRDYLDPFLTHAISRPYFMAWRLGQYPKEVGFGWTNDVIVPSNQRSNGMMQVSWTF
jgi:hypothetical protein